MRHAASGSGLTAAERAPWHAPGWLVGLMCGAALTLAPGLTIVLAALLAPGLLAQLLDRAPGKPAARAILLFGGCGCVGPMQQMWAQGSDAAARMQATALVRQTLAAPEALATAWLAAAGGWLVYEIAPVVVSAVLEAAEGKRLTRLRAERARYDAEWEAAPDL